MRQGEYELLVRMIERGDHWQRRCLILLYRTLGADLPRECQTEWRGDFNWIEEQTMARAPSEAEMARMYESATNGGV